MFSFYLFIYFLFYFLTSQYCIGSTIHHHESATGTHMLPILNPPPSSLPAPSLWVVPVHQPQASSIVHQTWTGDPFHIWYYIYFNAILPNHPTLSLSQLWYIYTMEYYSAIKKNTFEPVLMRWMKLEPIIQSEVSQKEKHQYSILTHIYGI